MKLKMFHLIAISATLLYAQAYPASADVITDWNLTTIEATKAQSPFSGTALNSNLGTRIDAIEAIAVYDAVNSVLHYGTPYHYDTPARRSSLGAATAAAVQAAHDVLINYFNTPANVAVLDSLLATNLAEIPDGPDKSEGIAAGSASAADIIALRANDGSSPNVSYGGPATITVGAYQLTPNIPTVDTPPFTFSPGINEQWGSVTPFVLTNSSQFRPPPPPAVESAAYLAGLNEVAELGTTNSPRHTAEETEIAQFYKQDAELTVNQTARLLSAAHNLSLAQNALFFLRVDLAEADSRIAEWEAKYYYLFWRPITALNANPDGVVTNNYSAWQPTIVTPNHPDYPSGHSGTVVGVEVIRAYFGDHNTFTLDTTTPGISPRTLTSLTELEVENGLSRIYGGIHFPFDNAAGQQLGFDVARYVLSHGPQPLR
jgi:hypothetical protein